MTLPRLLRRALGCPRLRERVAALRAATGGARDAAVPLPATDERPGAEEAAFLALLPTLLPATLRLDAARAEVSRLHDEAAAAAGACPGFDDPAALAAWSERARAIRARNGYRAAWDAYTALGAAVTPRVEPFAHVPMRTLPAILFKALLSDLTDRWGEGALADLHAMAGRHFGCRPPTTDA